VLLVFCTPWPVSGTASSNFVVYDKQVKKFLPKISIENRSYLPLIDFLQILDLPYSESASSGFITIGAGKNTIRLTRDRSVAQVNQAAVGLSAPVIFASDRWLVAPDFVPRVLNRVLAEKVVVSASGDRFLLGSGSFNRIEVKGLAAAEGSTIVIQMSAPAEVEIRKEDSKMVLNFGNTATDPSKEDHQYRDEMVKSIYFDDSSSADLLIIELTDRALQVKVTHLASQNAYLLELTRPLVASGPDHQPNSLPSTVIRSSQGQREWRHITIDAGHGGEDKGAFIKENLFEKDVALSIARKLRWAVQARLGVETALTRDGDQTLSLEQRAVAANTAQSDVFLSIHIGNRSHSAESSSRLYVAKLSSEKNDPSEPVKASGWGHTIQFLPWDQAQAKALNGSVRLAETLQAEINRRLPRESTSPAVHHASLKLLSSLVMPAVLVEIGNASQPESREMISDTHFQDSMVAMVLSALERFRSAYQRE
jgi:N-acetylmuramoyl-L-alanine amidase